MSGAVGILLFIATLIVMVMIHEAGHMTAARAFGMKVEEYFFGFGPRIFAFRRGETEYGMKAIPAGGYVKIAGMNPYLTVAESDLPRTFGAKPAWQRAIVLSAGSATHFLVAALLLTFSFAFLGVPGATTTLHSVSATAGKLNGQPGPAEKAGLKPGDRIVAIDGNAITKWEDLQNYIKARPGVPVTVTLDRGGQVLTFGVTPEQVTDTNNHPIGRIGVSPRITQNKEPLPAAAWDGVKGVGSAIAGSVQGLVHFFSRDGISQVVSSVTGSRNAAQSSQGDQAVGLVGGARLAGQAVQTGQAQSLITVLVLFIVFLGVLNLAPLPPLDGGHLAVLAIEKLRGRPVDPRKVVPVAAFVLSILVVLSVVVMYADIIHPAANPFQ